MIVGRMLFVFLEGLLSNHEVGCPKKDLFLSGISWQGECTFLRVFLSSDRALGCIAKRFKFRLQVTQDESDDSNLGDSVKE